MLLISNTMDELGQILREARETKGLTLAEVQAQTRINARFLEALETGEYAVLPSPVHVRGFLRNYSRFLELDPQPLVERYEQRQGAFAPAVTPNSRSIKADTLLPPRLDQPFFDPVNVDVEDGLQVQSESRLRLVIVAALLIALTLVGLRFLPLFFGNGDGTEVITEGVNQAVERLLNNSETPAAAEAAPDDLVDSGEIITSTGRNNFDDALPTPFPTRPALPATMESIPLKLEITERTWLEVTIDGDVVFSGIAKKGDPPLEYEAENEAKVVAGNGIAVFVTIGNVQLGRLGDRGQNVEETWKTTN